MTTISQKPGAIFNINAVGDTNSGKTSIIKRFYSSEFNSFERITYCMDLYSKIVTIDDCPVELRTADTAGQERFRAITSQYYRNAHAIFLVYDMSSQASFDSVTQFWLPQVKIMARDISVNYLVANKQDLRETEVCISREEGERQAKHSGLTYFEVSAKSGKNVDGIFTHCAARLSNLYNLNTESGGEFEVFTLHELTEAKNTTTDLSFPKRRKARRKCCK